MRNDYSDLFGSYRDSYHRAEGPEFDSQENICYNNACPDRLCTSLLKQYSGNSETSSKRKSL
jgi:hypothetical protein